MRVTKVVREYIEKKVTEKYMEKYADERAAAELERETRTKIFEAAEDAARIAFDECVRNYLDNNDFDFLQYNPEKINVYGNYNILCVKDMHNRNSKHCWHDRMSAEVKEKVSEIIVELELGGTKETLERLLAEI